MPERVTFSLSFCKETLFFLSETGVVARIIVMGLRSISVARRSTYLRERGPLKAWMLHKRMQVRSFFVCLHPPPPPKKARLHWRKLPAAGAATDGCRPTRARQARAGVTKAACVNTRAHRSS